MPFQWSETWQFVRYQFQAIFQADRSCMYCAQTACMYCSIMLVTW